MKERKKNKKMDCRNCIYYEDCKNDGFLLPNGWICDEFDCGVDDIFPKPYTDLLINENEKVKKYYDIKQGVDDQEC
ncbi:MAG: hypothetical protein ACTSRP_09175 [Candidatus Helarchaeota archaeon]